MRLTARLAGVGIVGPGFTDWSQAREVLAGRAAYAPARTIIPAAEALPAVERRRAGAAVRLSLAAGTAAAKNAGVDAEDLAAIFTASTGEGDTLHAICEALASDDRLISPTRFHNSVHNAPAGYWGIATGAMAPADCLGAYDASFGAGLLEAFGRLAADPSQGVIVIAYDAPYPEPLHAKRPIPDAFAVAMVLRSEGAGPALELEASTASPTTLSDAALERMRAQIPTARSLPLLQAVAKGGGDVVIHYLDDLSLAVKVAA